MQVRRADELALAVRHAVDVRDEARGCELTGRPAQVAIEPRNRRGPVANGSSGGMDSGSHAAIPEPRQVEEHFIILGYMIRHEAAVGIEQHLARTRLAGVSEHDTSARSYGRKRNHDDWWRAKMKHFTCMIPECGWTIERESEDEVVAGVGDHAREAHGMDEVPPEIEDRVRSRIVEQ